MKAMKLSDFHDCSTTDFMRALEKEELEKNWYGQLSYTPVYNWFMAVK